ncbi:MAG TPA: 3-oxoacyl-ACP reductase family protein [Symbiobacteriaceae bacterium]
MDLGLKDKVAVVVGGSRGIGRAVALALGREGARVAINYVQAAQAAEEAVRTIEREGGTAVAVQADVSNSAQVDAMFRTVVEKLGPVDILVHAAGIWPTARVVDIKEEDWRRTLDVNLTGVFLTNQWVVRHLLERKAPGKIVNFTSQAAFRGSTTGHAHYAAAKAGVVAFTVSLAREVAKYGIQVNAVAPGMVYTDMTAPVLHDPSYYLSRIPLGRIASPEEIADLVLFLVSERNTYMVGATVDISGGMLMR